MRPIYGLLALAALLFGLGSAQGWSMLHTLAYGLLLTIALSYAWSWWSVRRCFDLRWARMCESAQRSRT
jgi:hypothetical protein